MFDVDPEVKLQERDYNNSGVWTLRAPMLALSDPDPALALPAGTVLRPHILLRNTQAHPIHVTTQFHWSIGKQSLSAMLPPVLVKAYQTSDIDVLALQQSGLIPDTAHWTSVEIRTDSKPDELMAVALSYDNSLRYGAQTPFSDQLADALEGTEWRSDPTHTTLLTIGNGGNTSISVALTLFYGNNSDHYTVIRNILPGATSMVDISELVRSQTPDEDGQAIPAGTTSGSYQIELEDHPIRPAIYEGKVIVDRTYGYATYGCAICCGYANPSALYPNPAIGVVNNSSTIDVYAEQECTHLNQNIDEYYENWYSSNASIFAESFGSITGVSVGTTHANAFSPHLSLGGEGGGRPCPVYNSVVSSPGQISTGHSAYSL